MAVIKVIVSEGSTIRVALSESTLATLIGALGGGDLLSTNNLSDLADIPTARTNLGVYSQAQVDSAIANIDAENVSFLAPGAGAVARTVGDALSDDINVLNYGVVSGGITDNGPMLNAAAAEARLTGKRLYCPRLPGAIFVQTAVDFIGIREIEFLTAITVDPALNSIGVTVGGFATGKIIRWRFNDITNGTSVFAAPPANPMIRFIGAKSGSIQMGSCNYIQVYADAGAGAEFGSTAYNEFNLDGVVGTLELTDAGGSSWVNENRFIRGRLMRLRIISVGLSHNHNKFHHNTFEGPDVEIAYVRASANRIYDARFENIDGAPGVSFDADSYANTIEWTWSGEGVSRGEVKQRIAINDEGSGNAVYSLASATRQRRTIVSVDGNLIATGTESIAADPAIAPHNPGIDNTLTRAVITPGPVNFVVGINRYIAISPPVAVSRGDMIRYRADFAGSQIRLVTFVLDENLNPLTDEGAGGAFISQPSSVFAGQYGRYLSTSNLSVVQVNDLFTTNVERPEVKFIRVAFYAGSGASGIIRHISAELFSAPLNQKQVFVDGGVIRSLNGIPTRSYVPPDTVIWDRTASVMRRCTFQYETRLASPVAAGATSVTVNSIGGVANGDVVGVLLDDGVTHWAAVAGLSGETFTITPIPTGRSANGRVLFNRWV